MKHRLNRFTGYTPEDCECEYCLHYPGKGKPCPLEICCCADEKRAAAAPLQSSPPLPPLRRRLDPIMQDQALCRTRPECAGCAMPAHGFICHFASGGCVRYKSSLIGGAALVHA